MSAVEAICRRKEPARTAPSLMDLATLLHFSAGITRRRRYAGGEVLYRAASNTGACMKSSCTSSAGFSYKDSPPASIIQY